MLKIFSFIFFSISLTSIIAQDHLLLIDEEHRSPVSNAYLYDCHNNLVGISNEKGIIKLNQGICYPITIKHQEFEIFILNSKTNVISLNYKFKELDEVVIKPVNKMDLYNAIIHKSGKILSGDTSPVYGLYFESMVIVNLNKNDTAFSSKKCSMALRKEQDKKKVKYNFYCDQGERSFESFKKDDLGKDSSAIYNVLRILYGFEYSFKYDLSDRKKFRLEFEENEIKRASGESDALILPE